MNKFTWSSFLSYSKVYYNLFNLDHYVSYFYRVSATFALSVNFAPVKLFYSLSPLHWWLLCIVNTFALTTLTLSPNFDPLYLTYYNSLTLIPHHQSMYVIQSNPLLLNLSKKTRCKKVTNQTKVISRAKCHLWKSEIPYKSDYRAILTRSHSDNTIGKFNWVSFLVKVKNSLQDNVLTYRVGQKSLD